MPARHFEFEKGSSSKFWAIERQARTVTVTFGRIGSVGQKKAKSFPSDEKAVREEKRLIAEKTRKGYRELTGRAKTKAVLAAAEAEDEDVPDEDEDDDEPRPPPRGFTKPTSWQAIAKAWAGARTMLERERTGARQAKAVAAALGIARLPPSYLIYIDRFRKLGGLGLRYKRDRFPIDLFISPPEDLVSDQKDFIQLLDTFPWLGTQLEVSAKRLRRLIKFGRDTSRTDIYWDPTRTTRDGEMTICFMNWEYPWLLELGRDLKEIVKYYKPGLE
jgi:predicted DNA-binding WGR domain protein